MIGNGWISPRDQYPAYLDYVLQRGLVKKGSSRAKNIQVAVDKCKEEIAKMDIKDEGSGKGMVLISVCEEILSAVSQATMKE